MVNWRRCGLAMAAGLVLAAAAAAQEGRPERPEGPDGQRPGRRGDRAGRFGRGGFPQPNWDQVADRLELDPQQRQAFLDAVRRRAETAQRFFSENGDKMREMRQAMQEARQSGNQAAIEDLRTRQREFSQQMRTWRRDAETELANILGEEKMGRFRQEMRTSFGPQRQNRGPGGQDGADRRQRPGRRGRQTPEAGGQRQEPSAAVEPAIGAQPAPMIAAVVTEPTARATSRPAHRFDQHVRSFIEEYQLDEAQTKAAWAALADSKAWAEAYESQHAADFARLGELLAKKAETMPAERAGGNRAADELARLSAPIERELARLNKQLERIPTSAQRIAAKAGKGGPATRPAQ